MDAKDFRNPAAGKVVATPEGYSAFVPAPLPPKIEYNAELVRKLSDADAALSELSGLGTLLPNPHLLINPYVRREAVLSSRIEGTRTDLPDLYADEVGQEPNTPPADVQEVRNYIDALEYGVNRLQTLPLSLRLVKELHARLMAGVRGGHATPGEFRHSQNWIGSAGSTPSTATYVPPPMRAMHDCLERWEDFLHERTLQPVLIQCALVHEHFEAIHPFLDGNGRIGRLLITLFLIERKRLSQPLLYLSEFIEQNRQQYYDGLLRVRTHGDWQGWFDYFLTGVLTSAQRAVAQAAELMSLRDSMRQQVAESNKALRLVDELFINPYLDTNRVKALLGVTNPTARAAIKELEVAGIVVEVTGRPRAKKYLAKSVLDAIHHPGNLRT